MENTTNTQKVLPPIEEADTSLEHLEKIASSEVTDAQKQAFARAKNAFLKHIEEAKKNLSAMPDTSDGASRIALLEGRFASVLEKINALDTHKKSQQRGVIDSMVPASSDEKESDDMTIEDDRTYRKPLAEAYEAFDEKNYGKAMPLFDKAAMLAKGMKRMGKFAEGIFMKSQCLFDQNKFSEARKAFESVENNTKSVVNADEDVPKYYFGAIIRKALCAYNLKDNFYAAKIFLDEKLMEKAIPYEETSDQSAIKEVIADLKERVGKRVVSRK